MSPDERKISAAEGYLELQLWEDALIELESLTAEGAQMAEAVEVRLLYHFCQKDWEGAEELARQLTQNWPDATSGHIHLAYCLHEMGRTPEAVETLEQGPKALREKAVYFYNLGCYYTQLGKLKKALKLLERSFEMDETLRRNASDDPDLKPLAALLP
jgi:tetratricopeptide (TPR) repeat protein